MCVYKCVLNCENVVLKRVPPKTLGTAHEPTVIFLNQRIVNT